MASIEEARLLFKNLISYEKSVVMAKKYVKYHNAVINDLKRLEQVEEALKILKEKIYVLWQDEDLYLLKFNDYKKTETIKLTGKEYKIIKEVLEW